MSWLWLWLWVALAQEAPAPDVAPADPVEAPAEAPGEDVADEPVAEEPSDEVPIEEAAPIEPIPEVPAPEAPADAPTVGAPGTDAGDPGIRPPKGERPPPILEYGPELPRAEPIKEPGEFQGPMPQPEPSVVVVPSTESTSSVRDALPWVAARGFWSGLLMLVMALAFTGLAELLGRVRQGLADRGLLPALSSAASLGSRILAAFFGLGVIAAWIPVNLAPALPWVIVAGAVAMGWSVRDVLPDFVAWLALALEDRVRPGRWVSGSDFRGEVVRVGPRATVILDEWGGELSIPNRRLIQEPYGRDPSEWPKLEVVVALDPALDASSARRAIREAVLLSPWVAPGEVEIGGSTDGSGRWMVRVRLLEGTYLAVFEGSLRERVLEVLAARDTGARDSS